MPAFLPGIDLARAFYQEVVRPILARRWPSLPHSAALLGSGSEVLGYDDAVSTDHHWGPRLQLFLSARDHAAHAAAISCHLRAALPHSFRGYPTNFSPPSQAPDDQGTQLMQATSGGEVNHRVDALTIDGFLREHLGIGLAQALTAADWLSLPQQRLLGFSAGAVFHDDLGLEAARARFAWYPRDVWLYLLACAWMRIGQDEHLAPRAGAVGDELGAAVIAGRIIRSIMLLCFLMERRYAPYPKWLGSAFAKLDCAAELTPILLAAQRAGDFRQRETHLCAAYTTLNAMHNSLRLTAPIQPALLEFHGRGFVVSQAWRYVEALKSQIVDTAVQAIAERALIGSIDLFSDNTDLRESLNLREKIAALYKE